MLNQFSRTELIFGPEAMKKLSESRVAVFGIGGVGGHCAEALVRSGIGEIDIIDSDTVSITNINRQVVATMESVGRPKVDVMEERLKSINPCIKVNKHNCFFLPENAATFDFSSYDYVIDAVDTVAAKIEIILKAVQGSIPVISSMGAANKVDPTMFEVADIYKTSVCPLARVMRLELKKRGIKKLKVVYSKEKPIIPDEHAYEKLKNEESCTKRQIPGSAAFVPSVAGLIIAGEVVRDLTSFSYEGRVK